MSTEHQVLLHSDQGVQYSSAGYCNLLKEYNVIQSMSRAGNPHDNAVMESFWGRFKDALRKHFRYWECDDLRATIEQAIYYFNNERPVRKLKGKPPVLFRTELVA
jgi:putative transposase